MLLAGVILVAPWQKADKLGLFALFLLIAGGWAAGKVAWRRPGWPLAILVLVALASIPFAVVARAFGRVDMIALFFHAQAGMQGASIWQLKNEMIAVVLALIMLVLAAWLIAGLIRRGNWVLLGLSAVLVLANPAVRFGLMRLFMPPPKMDLMRMMERPMTLRPEGALPDLVIIYLEGLDRRFIDPAVGGDSYRPLEELGREGIVFTNIGQIAGTGWSLAGMVASQCGVPLMPRGSAAREFMEDISQRFMPEVECLGDVLARSGYASEFIVGADARFAGTSAFYATHGVAEQYAMERIETLFPPEEIAAAQMGWVLDDQMVFDVGRMRFEALIAREDPLFLVVETIGPHGKDGYISRSCSSSGRAEASQDRVAVTACLAAQVPVFVDDIRSAHRALGRENPLHILILSDHLNHGRDIFGGPPHLEANTAIMLQGNQPLGQGAAKGRVIDTPGAMIDIYPTVLEWLGYTARGEGAGLGRTLLSHSKRPPLVLHHGIPMLDRILIANGAFFDRLWLGSE